MYLRSLRIPDSGYSCSRRPAGNRLRSHKGGAKTGGYEPFAVTHARSRCLACLISDGGHGKKLVGFLQSRHDSLGDVRCTWGGSGARPQRGLKRGKRERERERKGEHDEELATFFVCRTDRRSAQLRPAVCVCVCVCVTCHPVPACHPQADPFDTHSDDSARGR